MIVIGISHLSSEIERPRRQPMYYAFVLLSFLLQEVTDEVATDPSAPQLFLENMGKVLQWVGVPVVVGALVFLAWKFLPGCAPLKIKILFNTYRACALYERIFLS